MLASVLLCAVLLFAVAQGGLPSLPQWNSDGMAQQISSRFPAEIATGGVDAVFQRANGKLYFFQDIYYWRVADRYLAAEFDNVIDTGFPLDFRNQFSLPNTIFKVDAIFQRSNGKIYLFSGDQYWRYEDNYINAPLPTLFTPDEGYPKKIADSFYGVPSNLKTAFTTPGGFIYFIDQENLVYRIRDKYVYEEIEEDIVDKCYPKNLQELFVDNDLAGVNIDAPYSILYRRQSNRKMYLFSGDSFVRFTHPQLWDDVERQIRPSSSDSIALETNTISFQRPNGDIWKFSGLTGQVCWDDMLRRFTATPRDNNYACTPSASLNTHLDLSGLPPSFPGFNAGFYSSYRGHVYLFYGRDIYSFPDKYFNDPTIREVPVKIGTLDDWGIPSSVAVVRSAYERANGKIYLFSRQGTFYRLSFPTLGGATDMPTVDAGFLPRPWCVPCRTDADCASLITPTCNSGNGFCQTEERCDGTPKTIDYFGSLVAPQHQRRNGYIYSNNWAVVDQNTRLVDECTYPWPQCYSNYECGSQRPYCANRGTSYAVCQGCRTDDDCAFFPSTPTCNVFEGHCHSGDLCLSNNNSFAIGCSQFVLFASDMNLERQCCSAPAQPLFTEGIHNAPGWSVVESLPTLFDPIGLKYQGLRSHINDASRLEALFETAFVVSAQRNSATSYENWVHTLANWREESCSRESPVEWLPLGPPTFSTAVPFDHAGNSRVNTKDFFYYDLEQSESQFKVRVLWDCRSDPTSCTRYIAVQNLGTEALENVQLLFNINANVRPSPVNAERFWATAPSAAWPGAVPSWAVLSKLTPDLITFDGQVRPLTQADVNADACLLNSGIAVNLESLAYSSADTTTACDTGVVVQFSFGDLPVGTWTSLGVKFSIEDSPATIQSTDKLVFSFRGVDAGTAWEAFNVAVHSQTEPAIPSSGPFIGECDCQNNGTCAEGSSIFTYTCDCPEGFLGDKCEKRCVNGVINAAGNCMCTEGWWSNDATLLCNTRCTCLRGSHCDMNTGNCFCKNGLVGSTCNSFPRCPSGSQ